MFIPPGIPPGNIVSELRATERFSAIRELLQHLVHVGAIPHLAEEPLFAAIRHREETMSTGVGFGIAAPHASSAAITEQVMALGRSSVGVDFASLDDQPVRTIVLTISPRSEQRAAA